MVSLHDLSIGQVAGTIAAGIFVLQLVLPSLVPLLVLGSLREHESTIEASAATWSLVARCLQSSYWPSLLRSDSAPATGQSRRVGLLVWLTPIAKILLAIAGIVTPLGLSESVVPSKAPQLHQFHYVRDPSILGFGTMPRSDLGFNRYCGGYPFWACPGAKYNVSESEWTEYTPWNSYDMRIPRILDDIFTSGLQSLDHSVSSIFDIQWRTYNTKNEPGLNNDSSYLVGDYRQLSTLLMNDKVEAVEGLIVDSRTGGIGFRNHSTPSEDLALGASWSEDILFAIPETRCVNTNLTIDFRVTDDALSQFKHSILLTDRGGFVDIDRSYEWWNLDDLGSDTQDTLDLRARAFKGAWLNNGLTMQVMNATGATLRGNGRFSYLNSFVGKQFILDSGNSSSWLIDHEAIYSSSAYGAYLSHLKFDFEPPSNDSLFYSNPFNITMNAFDVADILCEGQAGGDKANISNIGIACGLVIGMARPADNLDSIPLSYPLGSTWMSPIYSCASAVRARIRTVTFAYKGTGRDMLDLSILNIADKEYKSVEEKPVWIVENTTRNLSDYDPLWGLTSSMYKGYANTSTLQKEALWLPGYSAGIPLQGPTDKNKNIPGANFHTLAFSYAYRLSPSLDSGIFDYSGKNSLALFQKWFELTRNETGTSRMMSLIWTDLVANSVVGTHGWASQQRDRSRFAKRAEDPGDNALVPIFVYERNITFNYVYGIPAYVVCAFALVLGASTLVLGLMRRTGFQKLKKYINQTSLGRSLVSLLHPRECSQQQSRREWQMHGANIPIILGRERPFSAERAKFYAKDDAAARAGLWASSGSGGETHVVEWASMPSQPTYTTQIAHEASEPYGTDAHRIPNFIRV